MNNTLDIIDMVDNRLVLMSSELPDFLNIDLSIPASWGPGQCQVYAEAQLVWWCSLHNAIATNTHQSSLKLPTQSYIQQ